MKKMLVRLSPRIDMSEKTLLPPLLILVLPLLPHMVMGLDLLSDMDDSDLVPLFIVSIE